MTKDQALKAVHAIRALADIIIELAKASPLGGVPSGHVYAMFMAKLPGYTLESHQRLLDLLVEAGRIEVKNHCIYAVEAKPAFANN
jgi:hypothetical protein